MTQPGRLPFAGHTPHLAPGAWIAPGAQLIGNVSIGARSSIWYGAVLRGDGDSITVGAESNIQDGCVLHADPGKPVVLGDRVTVGHRAVVHGCTVGPDSLIGMGAVLLNGCQIGAGSMVAAGTVVLEGTIVAPGSLIAGVPGKVRRELSAAEQHGISESAATYLDLAARHSGAGA